MVFAMFSAVVAWEAALASLILLVTVGTKTAARIAMIAITTMSKWIVRRGEIEKAALTDGLKFVDNPFQEIPRLRSE